MRHLASIDRRKLLFRENVVGLTTSALHRRELLGVFRRFSPLLSEVQIHLPNLRCQTSP
jgi:hypothetical protein